MLTKAKTITLFVLVMLLISSQSNGQNPYVYERGTCWLTDAYDLITSDDPSTFENLAYVNEANAQMWDREANNDQGAWVTPLSWIYQLTYEDGITSKIRVRQLGFTKTEADSLAARYGYQMGQLPACLRRGTELINIMRGDALYGGNIWNHSIDITIGKTSELYHRTGNMEEILFHEATHASLDYLYRENWNDYSNEDPRYISKYASDNPDREDISESFLLTAGLTFRAERIPSLADRILSNLANRMKYLEILSLDMYPFTDNMEEEDSEKVSAPVEALDYYRLTCSWLGAEKSLTVINNQVQMTTSSNSASQQWKLEPLSEGYYRLTNKLKGVGYSLDVINDHMANKLQLASSGDYTGQFWKLEALEDGYYRLTTMFQGEGKSLDVINDGQNDKLHLAPSGNYSGQLWKLIRIK
ncbi:MAG: RICIN domain-containing protein [Cytophagales bacterium]|nr:RICIN domain-containing protein [Cytophagales bacterium]